MPARFSRDELRSFHGARVADLLGPSTRLLIVGINPGLWTAAVGAHFARRGNRFWPALHRAGITERLVDASDGMRPDDLEMVLRAGVGITNLAPIATARADEVSADDLRAGAARLRELASELRPAVVAVLGISAYRTAFDERSATPGRQPRDLAGSALWVLPNPSGLNAHETVDSLARSYREAAVAAGLTLHG